MEIERTRLPQPVLALAGLGLLLAACGGKSRPEEQGLPAGAACTADADCAGPGTPQCIEQGLTPLAELADSEDEMARSLAEVGVALPDGYCSTVPPCTSDADCGRGGSCFFPLREVDADTFAGLVATLGLPPQDAAVLEGFLDYGQCLRACAGDADCSRDGYVCAVPLEDFLQLVPEADLSTFCIGATPACEPDPCQHGSCTADSEGGYSCTCDPGWQGSDCDVNIDDCDPDPCLNGGSCVDEVDGYTCSCPAGYSGEHCETAVAGCEDDPCVHGSCSDTGPGEYECDCEPGWTGDHCDVDIDDCDPDPCLNGGSCVDEVAGFHCDCSTAPGWQGALCDTDVPDCADEPCVHGTCVEGEPGTGAFACECDAGWQGTLCDTDVPDCAQDPCIHGTCVEGEPGTGAFSCDCEAGWEGELCAVNSDDCDPNPCQNGGTCTDGIDGYTCSCPAGYSGPNCENEVSGCADDPCAHGTCSDTGPGSYECQCDAGWTGVNCDENIDDCDPNPCQNGGSCVDEVAGFHCDCATAPGWQGALCDTDVPDCAAEPCVHGTCIEGEPGTGEYSCDCEAGWQGALCDTDVPDCAAEPCVHGTCIEGDPGTGEYGCDCEAGWEGQHCDQLIDLCTPNPCLNGGSCSMDGPAAYSCSCVDGYSGEHCETPPATTTCVLTYDLLPGNGADDASWTGCNLRIRNTFWGLGDGTNGVGPGTLILRLPSDGADAPAAGEAEVLYYHLVQEFVMDQTGALVTTDVDAASPELGQVDNDAAVAWGTLSLDAEPTISWDACDYPAGYDDSNESFTPDVVGSGDGCLAPYRSTGNIHCQGWACGSGGMNEGDNPQDETWQQRLQPLTFSADFYNFSMPFTQVPNRAPSRSYMSWEGELIDIQCW